MGLLVLAAAAQGVGQLRGNRQLGTAGQLHALPHLGEGGVAEEDDGVAVLLRQLEALLHQLAELLDGVGCQDQVAVVAVAAALDGLEIIALGRQDLAVGGAGAHDLHDDGGQIRRGHVAHGLLAQAEARTGGGGHGPVARGGGARHHVEGGHLSLRLDEGDALLRPLPHGPGVVLGDLAGGGDGVAEEELAAGTDGGLRHGLVALHENLISHTHPPQSSRYTAMAESGQTRPQVPQPMQPSPTTGG